MGAIGKQSLTVSSIALGLMLAGPGAAKAAPKDPSGTYLTEDGRGRIRVEKCGPQLANICGYLVWIKTPAADSGKSKFDSRNPDAAKKTRPILGHQLMMGLALAKDETYQGLIYNNEDGKSYNVTIYMEDDVLKVKGCLVAFLCKTETWTRADDLLPGQLAGATGSPAGPQPDAEWRPKTAASDVAPDGSVQAKAAVKAKQKP